MKCRNDFVTNSSSSSFIISKNDVSKDKLIEILLEIANESDKEWCNGDEDYPYTLDNSVKDDCVAYNYNIYEGTESSPHYQDILYVDRYEDVAYTNNFVIDNDCGIRYDWDIVGKILNKYGIPWEIGYCD